MSRLLVSGPAGAAAGSGGRVARRRSPGRASQPWGVLGLVVVFLGLAGPARAGFTKAGISVAGGVQSVGSRTLSITVGQSLAGTCRSGQSTMSAGRWGQAQPSAPPVSSAEGGSRADLVAGLSVGSTILRSSAAIHYVVPERAGNVSLDVFGVDGRLVRRLLQGEPAAGHGSVAWDGRNDHGSLVGGGMYFVRFASAGFAMARKIVVAR